MKFQGTGEKLQDEPNGFSDRSVPVLFSRKEPRMHVHVVCADGEVKYWLDPTIELAKNYGLSRSQLKEIERLIEEHRDELQSAWKKHFGG
jgi:hypothetical protein